MDIKHWALVETLKVIGEVLDVNEQQVIEN